MTSSMVGSSSTGGPRSGGIEGRAPDFAIAAMGSGAYALRLAKSNISSVVLGTCRGEGRGGE